MNLKSCAFSFSSRTLFFLSVLVVNETLEKYMKRQASYKGATWMDHYFQCHSFLLLGFQSTLAVHFEMLWHGRKQSNSREIFLARALFGEKGDIVFFCLQYFPVLILGFHLLLLGLCSPVIFVLAITTLIPAFQWFQFTGASHCQLSCYLISWFLLQCCLFYISTFTNLLWNLNISRYSQHRHTICSLVITFYLRLEITLIVSVLDCLRCCCCYV